MRPVFLWSDWGSTAFLGHWLKRAGIPVTLYIRDEGSRDIARGLLPKTTDPNPPKESLVIFDGIGHGELGKRLRSRGQLVVGGNILDDQLEKERYSGIRLMQKVGITVPVTKNFTNVAAARAFLEQETKEAHWFIKVSGGNTSEASTCNGDQESLLRYLTYIAKQPGDKTFILQEQVEGVEVSTNGWFNGHQWVPPFDGTFEEKKLFPGDLGPRTGCEHCVVWLHQNPRLPQETVRKITHVLQESQYVGPVDLNTIVSPAGVVYGLEWTARLGFDATQAWFRFFRSPKEFVQQLEAFAAGFLARWELRPEKYATTIRVSLPPYPNSNRAENKRMAGFPVDKAWLKGSEEGPYCMEDIMQSESGPVSAGASGLTGVLSVLDQDFKSGVKQVLSVAHALHTPMQQYREDILTRAEGDWKTLTKLGMISGPSA